MGINEILNILVTTLMAVCAFYFKRNLERQDKSMEQMQKQVDDTKTELLDKIEENQKNLAAYKLEAMKEFATKDEFIRATSNINQKLDKIYDEICKLKGGNN